MAIESDSVQPVPRFRQELFRMMAVAADTLQRLGARVTSVDMGSQQVLWCSRPPREQLLLDINCAFPGVARERFTLILNQNPPIPNEDEAFPWSRTKLCYCFPVLSGLQGWDGLLEASADDK